MSLSGDQTTLEGIAPQAPPKASDRITPQDTERGYFVPPISVDDGVVKLRERLGELVQREARLDSTGITCPLKDCDEMSCLACPFSMAGDDTAPKAALCQIGQQQEITLAHLLAAKAREAEPVGV